MDMGPSDDPTATRSRAARLALLRVQAAEDLDTLTFVNTLVEILWGLPGALQIAFCVDTIAEVVADSTGEPGTVHRLLEILAELRALAEIPGEEAVVDDALVDSLPDVDAHPALAAAVKSLWPLFDAVDDRASSQSVTLESVKCIHTLLFAVVETAMDRHASVDDLIRWRARQPGAPWPSPEDIPAVNAQFPGFYLRVIDRLDAAGVAGYPEPEFPSRDRWPLFYRVTGRCCGSLERHQSSLLANRSRLVRRLLLQRAVHLECGAETSCDHLRLALRGEPRPLALRLASTLVRRAYPLFPKLHSSAIEALIRCAEALGADEQAPSLSLDLLHEIAFTEQPPVLDPGAVSFYWSVRSLVKAVQHIDDPDLHVKHVADAVARSIDGRSWARLALEEPESWVEYVDAIEATASGGRDRAAQANVWLVRRLPVGVEKDELEIGWSLVLEMLEIKPTVAR
jgi:hypothetical protein